MMMERPSAREGLRSDLGSPDPNGSVIVLRLLLPGPDPTKDRIRPDTNREHTRPAIMSEPLSRGGFSQAGGRRWGPVRRRTARQTARGTPQATARVTAAPAGPAYPLWPHNSSSSCASRIRGTFEPRKHSGFADPTDSCSCPVRPIQQFAWNMLVITPCVAWMQNRSITILSTLFSQRQYRTTRVTGATGNASGDFRFPRICPGTVQLRYLQRQNGLSGNSRQNGVAGLDSDFRGERQ